MSNTVSQPGNASLLKLLQLASPALPIGAYSYSQGLEWAVHAGWISSLDNFKQWVHEQLFGTIAQQDLPLLLRMYRAAQNSDERDLLYWDNIALSMRETGELRHEEQQRGRAMSNLLNSFEMTRVDTRTQLAAVALYCAQENIPLEQSLTGYAYSWIESIVTAGIKLVPLGQTDGQKLLFNSTAEILHAVEIAQSVDDDGIGYTSPAVAIASSQHETQYSRLFRS